jgi:hypothetical protein
MTNADIIINYTTQALLSFHPYTTFVIVLTEKIKIGVG